MSARPFGFADPMAAKANATAAVGTTGLSLAGSSDAPAVQISEVFALQSYCDPALQQQALLRQPNSELIVPSTLKSRELSGYGVALHPSTETPVAISFFAGGQKGASQVHYLKPGEVLRPYGLPSGKSGRFSGFQWGLPFGWLGGGAATLIIFRTEDAHVRWASDHNEIIFHRVTLPILDGSTLTTAQLLKNWPLRFPWPGAVFQDTASNQISQRGQPVLSVQPTRTLLRLRMQTLSNAATMRCVFWGSDTFETTPGDNSAVPAAIDVTWGTWASTSDNGVWANTQFQTQMLTGEMERIEDNLGGLVLLDLSGGTLAGQTVDFIRYGRL